MSGFFPEFPSPAIVSAIWAIYWPWREGGGGCNSNSKSEVYMEETQWVGTFPDIQSAFTEDERPGMY